MWIYHTSFGVMLTVGARDFVYSWLIGQLMCGYMTMLLRMSGTHTLSITH
jgi:hypothetical protein